MVSPDDIKGKDLWMLWPDSPDLWRVHVNGSLVGPSGNTADCSPIWRDGKDAGTGINMSTRLNLQDLFYTREDAIKEFRIHSEELFNKWQAQMDRMIADVNKWMKDNASFIIDLATRVSVRYSAESLTHGDIDLADRFIRDVEKFCLVARTREISSTISAVLVVQGKIDRAETLLAEGGRNGKQDTKP